LIGDEATSPASPAPTSLGLHVYEVMLLQKNNPYIFVVETKYEPTCIVEKLKYTLSCSTAHKQLLESSYF